jgi:hypothetical protein
MNSVKPHKVSTHSAHSDNCYLHFLSWLSEWLKNKKVLFLKKYFFGRSQYQNKKALFTDSIFREGFDLVHVGIECPPCQD